jgi:hypothetical protein
MCYKKVLPSLLLPRLWLRLLPQPHPRRPRLLPPRVANPPLRPPQPVEVLQPVVVHHHTSHVPDLHAVPLPLRLLPAGLHHPAIVIAAVLRPRPRPLPPGHDLDHIVEAVVVTRTRTNPPLPLPRLVAIVPVAAAVDHAVGIAKVLVCSHLDATHFKLFLAVEKTA